MLARRLDQLEGNILFLLTYLTLQTEKEIWKNIKECSYYDWKEVRFINQLLVEKKEISDINGILHFLRTSLVKNIYSTQNKNLYFHTNTGTKKDVETFVGEITQTLDYIANYNENILPLEIKYEFFNETRQSYGKTALMLSGTILFIELTSN